MSFETVEEAIVYVLKKQKSYIEAEADAARAKGDITPRRCTSKS